MMWEILAEIGRALIAGVIFSLVTLIPAWVFGMVLGGMHNEQLNSRYKPTHEWHPFFRMLLWIKFPFRLLRSHTSRLQAKLEKAEQLELELRGVLKEKIPEDDPWRPHFETTLQEARRKKKETQMKLQEVVADSYAKKLKKIGD